MTRPTASIIISSHDRLPLLKRSLWSISRHGPPVPFEVVVCDDGSSEDVLGALKSFSSAFLWKFVRFDAGEFEAKTGLKKFLGNPAVTNNIAFKHASGDLIFQQGNEVIAVEGCYDRLIDDAPRTEPGSYTAFANWLVVSTTYDVPAQHLNRLDEYGTNINKEFVRKLYQWPLQSREYRSDVTNYISLSTREVWEALGGYDERYYGGISAEDSDFVRRARMLDGFKMVVSEGVSLHQFHSGMTCYYTPPPNVITPARWREGVAINHAIFNVKPTSPVNPQKWPWGEIGVGEVITNG